MISQKRKYRVAFIVATVVLAGAVAFGGWWIAGNTNILRNSVDQEALRQSLLANMDRLPFVIAAREDSTVDVYSDDTVRSVPYGISVFYPDSGEERHITKINANMFAHAFAYQDDAIYFIDSDGELSMHNAETGLDTKLTLPDIEAVYAYLGDHSLSDFVLSDDTIFYLQGTCQGTSPCHLRSYNFTTKTLSPIIDNLQTVLKLTKTESLRLQGYRPEDSIVNLIKVRNSGGKIAHELIEASVATRRTTVIPLGSSSQYSGGYIKQIQCGATATEELAYDAKSKGAVSTIRLDLPEGGGEKRWSDAYIAGCGSI